MSPLLDILGPSARCSAIKSALARLARQNDSERGLVSTPPEVVNALLDLAGYTPDQPLHRRRLLEPAFGRGEVLLAAIERLLAVYSLAGGQASMAVCELRDAIRAVELHIADYEATARDVEARLVAAGLSERDAHRLRTAWLIRDDFLLCHLQGEFDCVVGRPPQMRLERLPGVLRREYRRRFHTLYDRADISIAVFERALDRLALGGRLGFVGSGRWLRNKSGGPLRTKVALGFALTHFIDLANLDALASNGLAEAALMFIERPPDDLQAGASGTTRLVKPGVLSLVEQLPYLVTALETESLDDALLAEVRLGGARRDAPWLLDGGKHLDVIRRLEQTYPTLEEVGCKVSHGVATGCDRVFIDDYPSLPVEPSCKLPLVMARDLVAGTIQWHGQGVINPFRADGRLIDLDEYPRLADYLERHRATIAGRHIARRNPAAWYRTIDRIDPSLVGQPKLLVADIQGETQVAFDEGHFYPHHSLCSVITSEWAPRALQAVLRSSVAVAMAATYGTHSAGGYTRLQASSLRRLRIPRWTEVSAALRAELTAVALAGDRDAVDEAVFRLYGLDGREAEYIRAMARWQ